MARNGDIGPEHHLSRLMTRELDPTTGAKKEPLRRLWPAAILGTLVLALFNAQGLEKWAARLPETGISNAVIAGSQQWKEKMDRAGPARLFAAVREAFQKFRGQ